MSCRFANSMSAVRVVALAGRSVGHGVGVLLRRDLDLRLGDERPRDRRAEQVTALVHGIRAQHREEEVADELLAEIDDVNRAGAGAQGLLADRDGLLALAHIGAERHDLAAVALDEPSQDDRGVEPARIGQHDLLRVRVTHWRPSVSATMIAF
jgi:hypothetical protein